MAFAVIFMVLTVGCSKKGKLVFDEYELQRNINNDSVRFELSIVAELPKPNCKGEVADSIRLFLSRSLFSIEQIEEPNAMLKRYADTVLANYCADMRDFRRVAGFTDLFHQEIVGVANILSPELLSYDKSTYLYYGGSQGQRRFNSYVFSLVDGKCLLEEDLYQEGKEEELSKLLTEALKELTHGEFQELVIPNNNFTVIDEGIVYRYDGFELNTFEIPAVECIDLQIPSEKILPLLKEESVVYKYLNSQLNAEAK